MWCLLAGHTDPWFGVIDFKERTQRGERPSLDDIRSDAPPGLVELMQQAWDQDPRRRPTAEVMAVALEEMLAALG